MAQTGRTKAAPDFALMQRATDMVSTLHGFGRFHPGYNKIIASTVDLLEAQIDLIKLQNDMLDAIYDSQKNDEQ